MTDLQFYMIVGMFVIIGSGTTFCVVGLYSAWKDLNLLGAMMNRNMESVRYNERMVEHHLNKHVHMFRALFTKVGLPFVTSLDEDSPEAPPEDVVKH